MSSTLRKLGLAATAAVFLSAGSASAAFAANPLLVDYSPSTGELSITDTTGVNQATTISSLGGGNYNITEANSGNEFVAGGDIAAAEYTPRQWTVGADGPITRIVLNGEGGNDGLDATGVTDVPVTIYGDAGVDFLKGGTQNDLISGGSGNDYVYGGAGNDTLSGLDGADHVYGQDGNDQIFEVDHTIDTVDGGNGTDDFTGDATDVSSNIEHYH